MAFSKDNQGTQAQMSGRCWTAKAELSTNAEEGEVVTLSLLWDAGEPCTAERIRLPFQSTHPGSWGNSEELGKIPIHGSVQTAVFTC